MKLMFDLAKTFENCRLAIVQELVVDNGEPFEVAYGGGSTRDKDIA
jgi:hypothetical protein